MPFDASPQFKTDTIFSLEGLVAWLETQDPQTEYNLYCRRGCVMGRYYRAYIPKAVESAGAFNSWIDARRRIHTTSFDEDALFNIVQPTPHTFGAALTRARALLAGES